MVILSKLLREKSDRKDAGVAWAWGMPREKKETRKSNNREKAWRDTKEETDREQKTRRWFRINERQEQSKG